MTTPTTAASVPGDAEILAALGLKDARQGERAIGHSGPENNQWEEYVEVPMQQLRELFVARTLDAQPSGDCWTCGNPKHPGEHCKDPKWATASMCDKLLARALSAESKLRNAPPIAQQGGDVECAHDLVQDDEHPNWVCCQKCDVSRRKHPEAALATPLASSGEA